MLHFFASQETLTKQDEREKLKIDLHFQVIPHSIVFCVFHRNHWVQFKNYLIYELSFTKLIAKKFHESWIKILLFVNHNIQFDY